MHFVNSSVQTEDLENLLPKSDSSCAESSSVNSLRTVFHKRLATSLHSLQIMKARKETLMSGKIKKLLFLVLCILFFAGILLGFLGNLSLCHESNYICNLSIFKSNKPNELAKNQYHSIETVGKPLSQLLGKANLPSFEDVVSKDFMFDIEDHDVIVFLHMQKTGGTTFGKHLVNDLDLQRDCVCHRKIKKRCTCLRPGLNSKETWLFSRYSTGWKCGLHADWTELTGCVDDILYKIDDAENAVQRRYFYITYLRHPVARYLSEFRHVRRGATWKKAGLFCRGRSATKAEVPTCYEGENWSDVELEEFITCPSNLANNRQTRMLADLTLVDCYNTATMSPQDRDTVMLASAKRNLRQISFFGIIEHQERSQYLFEETFNLKFNIRFEQYNHTNTERLHKKIDSRLIKKIEQLNSLDIQLYEYALKLQEQRFEHLKAADVHFHDHFNNMGNVELSWRDIEEED